MARTAVLGRLIWQLGEVAELVQETPRVASLVLDMPAWPGHLAGQHVDVRLTADDGYQAERSYSIASAPEDRRLGVTVGRRAHRRGSPFPGRGGGQGGKAAPARPPRRGSTRG